MRLMRWLCVVVVLLLAAVPATAAEMDYGSLLSSSLDRNPAVSKQHADQSTEQTGQDDNNLATKAITADLGGGAVSFDTELLTYAAGWTGGFLNLKYTHLTSEKGSVPPSPAGPLAFTAPLRTPGWSIGRQGNFDDPRPKPFGPLPRSIGRYRGLYRQGDQVVFRYTVGKTDVLDLPGIATHEDRVVFTRTLRIGPGVEPLSILVCKAGPAVFVQESSLVQMRKGNGRIWLEVAGKRAGNATVGIAISASGFAGVSPAIPAVHARQLEDLDRLIHGGRAAWSEEVITVARPASSDSKPYVVDELTLPTKNAWNAWLRPTGFDFFKDGTRAALCTWNGDVWIVGGIGSNPEKLIWRRFAAGLYEPLGLAIVDDVVYVRGRDQITRLHDLNADGEADFYDNFNNDGVASANYHGFAMDLVADAEGNFYYVRCGQRMHPDLPGQGSVIRVSRDGATSTVVASGLRAANGLGIGPNGELTAADNQGNWTPSCRLNLIRPGGFYGYMPHVRAAGGPTRDDYDPPMCWLPMSVDNSAGSQAWIPKSETRWGPFAGQMLHTSYGRASLMLVLRDESAPASAPNAGVVRFPLSFSSGVMRARFNPRDGQLYLAGMKGWQTAGPQDGTLCRVRFTGKETVMPLSFRTHHNGIELTFTAPLDPETANDAESFGVEQWNYRWTKEYGSADYSVTDPEKKQRDEVEVKSAKLRPDGRTVFLEIPDLKPVMQMSIQYDLDTKSGETINDTIYLTLNHVPGHAK